MKTRRKSIFTRISEWIDEPDERRDLSFDQRFNYQALRVVVVVLSAIIITGLYITALSFLWTASSAAGCVMLVGTLIYGFGYMVWKALHLPEPK